LEIFFTRDFCRTENRNYVLAKLKARLFFNKGLYIFFSLIVPNLKELANHCISLEISQGLYLTLILLLSLAAVIRRNRDF